LSHGVETIPVDEKKATASADDELILLTLDWNAEATKKAKSIDK
jgi:hypothetical protein